MRKKLTIAEVNEIMQLRDDVKRKMEISLMWALNFIDMYRADLNFDFIDDDHYTDARKALSNSMNLFDWEDEIGA